MDDNYKDVIGFAIHNRLIVFLTFFSELDKLILEYATAVSRTPVEVPDELFGGLRAHFDEAQLVGLTHIITLGNLRGRFNLALGIGASGFSEGRVCALPDTDRR